MNNDRLQEVMLPDPVDYQHLMDRLQHNHRAGLWAEELQ